MYGLCLTFESLAQRLLVGLDYDLQLWLIILLKRSHILLTLSCMGLQHSAQQLHFSILTPLPGFLCSDQHELERDSKTTNVVKQLVNLAFLDHAQLVFEHTGCSLHFSMMKPPRQA